MTFKYLSTELVQNLRHMIDWLIGASLSSYHEKATVRYILDESAPA